MRDTDFSADAKDLMKSELFSEGSLPGQISWSEEMIEMYLRCEGRCVYCCRDMLESYIIHTFDAQTDHLLPKSVYPELENEPTNKVVACFACNKVKGRWDANVYGGERRNVKDNRLWPADQKEIIRRVRNVNEDYEKRYEKTFAKQKEILLGILARAEQAKAAHN